MALSAKAAQAAQQTDTNTNRWSAYMVQLYNTRIPPSIKSFDFSRLETEAREKTKAYHGAYMYTFGSAGSCDTARANVRALHQWRIVPRMLRDASARSLETTLFGVKYPCPLFVAPVGVQGILHADGELATARAAAKTGVPLIMSTASSRSIEDVGKANGDSQRWYQLYWPRTDEITLSILRRAKAAGFTALVVTLDTMLLGWRPHDLETGYLPFLYGVGSQVGMSDPVFMARAGLEPRHDHPAFPFYPNVLQSRIERGDKEAAEAHKLGELFLQETNSGEFKTWDQLRLLQDNWDGPIILKGIQHVDDAIKAIDVGISGIIVSNHGGRQVDGALPSIIALENITADQRVQDAQRSGKFTILFDSGIRTGSDVLKAIALGAQGVLVARPFMYGLAINGETGVEEVLRGLLADTEISLGLSGYKDINEIWYKKEDFMTKVDPSLV